MSSVGRGGGRRRSPLVEKVEEWGIGVGDDADG